MATPSLPSTNSIIDYLDAQGQNSSFSSRTKLYRTSGLADRLGSYVGSSSQNLALLDYLRKQSSTPQAPTTSFIDSSYKNNAYFPYTGRTDSPENPTSGTQAPKFYEGAAPPNAFEGSTQIQPNQNGYYATSGVQPFSATDIWNRITGKGGVPLVTPKTPENFIPTQTSSSTPSGTTTQTGGGTSDWLQNFFGESYGYEKTPTGYKTSYEPGTLAKLFGKEATSKEYTTVPEPLSETSKQNIRDYNARLDAERAAAQAPQTQIPGAAGGTPLNQATRAQLDGLMAQLQQAQTMLDDYVARQNASGAVDQAVSVNTGGISGSTIAGQDASVTEIDFINQWLDSAEGKLALEKYQLGNQTAQQAAEVAKEALETKYKSEKKTLEENLAARGLAFSGIRGTEVKALADALAASELNVDREFANKLLDADIRFRETVLAGVADLIKAAKDNEADSIRQLNLMGYAVVGDQLLPTLSLLKEQRIAEAGNLTIQTNSSGQVTAIDKNTGQVVWRTEGGIGRSGSSSPNIQVTPISDPVTGTVQYIQRRDDSGNITWTDVSTGQEVSPDQVQIEDGKDDLDRILDEILGSLSFEDFFPNQ